MILTTDYSLNEMSTFLITHSMHYINAKKWRENIDNLDLVDFTVECTWANLGGSNGIYKRSVEGVGEIGL